MSRTAATCASGVHSMMRNDMFATIDGDPGGENMADGRIVEHWDIIRPTPENTDNTNSMF
jgi:predicted SnoaL-like aldol condensation-catalyzing enzyme